MRGVPSLALTRDERGRPVQLRTHLLFIATLLTLGAATFGQSVPQAMSFQGRVTRSTGASASSGNYTVLFSLWDSLSGGARLWSQQISPSP
jgi:hypothetical protein